MSKKYIGGLITKTPVTPAGPYQTGAASGVWTLEQMQYYVKQGIWPIAGNVEQIGQQAFIGIFNANGSASQDSYSFVVPSGVTSISAVCIGSGASGNRNDSAASPGRAGDLRYATSIAVTPGETLTILVAQGTTFGTNFQWAGTSSEIKRGSTVLLSAVGGGDRTTTSGTASTPLSATVGGGLGGDGGFSNSTYSGGGGGTAGYNGDGGAGMAGSGSYANVPVAGSGAAYGGSRSASLAVCGGGVNILGIGTTATSGDEAGSYGSYAQANYQDLSGMYGGGGGGNDSASGQAGAGRPGAVRIIWGNSRTYPSNASDYLPMSSSSFTEIELRFKQIYIGTNSSPIATPMSELEILDETNTNIMRSPTILTAVAGSNSLSFASLSNNQFGGNTSTLSATDAQTLNSGTVEASYIGLTKTNSDTVSLLIKLSTAKKIKQVKIITGSTSGLANWFIPYIEVYGNGVLIGGGCPVPTYNSPTLGNVTSTLTFT